MKNHKTIILFTAHPDDHLLCAGTLMKLADKGFYIVEVVFTGGEKSVWYGKEKFKKSELKKQRAKEWLLARKLIGIKEGYSLGLEDSNFQRDIKIVYQVIKLIRQYKPYLVITHYYDDYHRDHNEVSKIVTEAVDRAGWGIAKELGELHKTPVFLYMDGEYLNRGDILVDVSEYLSKIEEVMNVYGSQMSERMKNFLKSILTYRGFFLRTQAAESFEIGRRYPLKFKDNFDQFLELWKN
jgi:LmbE family N-acetylglucosaminyl deacetylase